MGDRRLSSTVLFSILAFILVLEDASGVTSPWEYRCNSESGLCVKEETMNPLNQTSLTRCKLTCSPEGLLWPKPASVSLVNDVVQFLPSGVDYSTSGPTDNIEDLLDQAVDIFINNLNRSHPMYMKETNLWEGPYNAMTADHQLQINITVNGKEERLALNINESYSLSLSTSGSLSTAEIVAPTFFGARHALETLSQLTDYDETSGALLLVAGADINDAPAFTYRGILLDTARNFIPVESLEHTLDAMAANKLNTFHWHITDSQSFPVHLESLPKMSYYGAYSSKEIYYAEDIRKLVEYGRVRGIRVMPEFDAPAHVGNGFQWGPQQDMGNLAVCINREPWNSYCSEPPCGQLNLANEKMYDVLGQIYMEFNTLFDPLDLFHFGGDEVNLKCWNTTDEIVDWMTKNNYGLTEEAYFDQWGVFQSKAYQRLVDAKDGTKIPGIIWTSDLTKAERIEKHLPKEDYIIQIWTTGKDPVIKDLLDKEYRVIFSNYDHWYLDCGFGGWVTDGNNWCSPYKGWQKVYDNNPVQIALSFTTNFNASQILGGEAALWTEQADESTLDSRLWPRGAALGERLWSNPEHDWKANMTEIRLINQRQRMVHRGIRCDRIQPQWCYQNEGQCRL